MQGLEYQIGELVLNPFGNQSFEEGNDVTPALFFQLERERSCREEGLLGDHYY